MFAFQNNLSAVTIPPLNGDSGSGKLSRRLASADHVPTHKSSEPHVMYYELSDVQKRERQEAQEQRQQETRERTTSVGLKPSGKLFDLFWLLDTPAEIGDSANDS